jgi:hypothetical protein
MASGEWEIRREKQERRNKKREWRMENGERKVAPLLHSLLFILYSPFALRPSPQKKSPPAFARGLSKLGYDRWITC